MSLTLIAMTGILAGLLCLVIGFFMEDTSSHTAIHTVPGKSGRSAKKKAVVARKKAA